MIYKGLILSDPPQDARSGKILKTVVDLLDRILIEEYDPLYASLKVTNPVLDVEQDRVECDFCGADVFLSFLQCNHCFISRESSSESDAEGLAVAANVVLCSACYVAGRTYACTHLSPTQYWPFADLVATRNRFAAMLSTQGMAQPALGFDIEPRYLTVLH